jgi:N-acetylglutamate synthase
MNMMEIERAARLAWPALEEQELPFGVLRYSRGTDRRANSLNLYPDVGFDPISLIGVVEEFFHERGAAPIVKITHMDDSEEDVLADIDIALADRGYQKQAPTYSMLLDLSGRATSEKVTQHSCIEVVDVGPWLEAWFDLADKDFEKIEVHKALLSESKLAQRHLLFRGCTGNAIGSGMAVYANHSIGLFGITTAVAHRNKGNALEILNSLLEWGVSQGAKFAYLQVEEANHAALSLYRKLGFRNSYSYWYRVGKNSSHILRGTENE